MRSARGKPGTVPDPLEFLRVLWSVHHALESASRRMKARWKVTGRERIVLRVIGARPGISAGELALFLHVDPSTVTGTLDRLVRRRFVKRVPRPGDARRAALTLREAARPIERARTGTIEARVERALARHPPAEIRMLISALGRIAEALDAQGPSVRKAISPSPARASRARGRRAS